MQGRSWIVATNCIATGAHVAKRRHDMTGVIIIERLLDICDETVFPLLAAYAVWLLRTWLMPKP